MTWWPDHVPYKRTTDFGGQLSEPVDLDITQEDIDLARAIMEDVDKNSTGFAWAYKTSRPVSPEQCAWERTRFRGNPFSKPKETE